MPGSSEGKARERPLEPTQGGPASSSRPRSTGTKDSKRQERHEHCRIFCGAWSRTIWRRREGRSDEVPHVASKRGSLTKPPRTLLLVRASPPEYNRGSSRDLPSNTGDELRVSLAEFNGSITSRFASGNAFGLVCRRERRVDPPPRVLATGPRSWPASRQAGRGMRRTIAQ